MKMMKRVLALLLCLGMVAGIVPASVFAVDSGITLADALAEAKTYIDGITINSSSNDPETVVKNFKTHFTWDNEKREGSKSYLFDWSYYNGVVFEGLEYLYEVTKDDQYKAYVVEYMSSLIDANGGWATCTNNSSKQCAGYNSTHGADCYKTASLLLDAYEMTKDSRYLTMAATLYADLDKAAESYLLPNAGNNYRHTWASDSTPDLWLDGLYMILPFRAEYAKHIGDTEELKLIVDRMQWVSDNMYDKDKGLFYHAADSASSNSGTFWLRSIGWYAAAIVDIMDSMEGENLAAMQAQLVKLVDGMLAVQNTKNGMWLNNMAASQSSTNPYETSGTALVCYAIMKAVNNGWLNRSYADKAILAFKGICDEKLSNNNLTDICFKGAPGSSNSTFYDNEGKGVGPFIMFYAEVLEYYNSVASISVTPPTKLSYVKGEALAIEGLVVTATYVNGTVKEVSGYLLSGFDANKVGKQTITVTYGGCSASFEITVSEKSEGIAEQTFWSEDTFASVTATATGATLEKITVDTAADALLSFWYGYDISLTEQVEGTATTITLFLHPDGMSSANFAVYFYNTETGAYEPVSGYTVAKDEVDVEYITISNAKLGKYIYGTPVVTVPEGATLEKLVISGPEKTKYFLESAAISESGTVYLDITGLRVTAVFSDGTQKELGWNEFKADVDGYSLDFGTLDKAGTYPVTVSYTYGEKTATATFEVEIYNKCFESEDSSVSVEVSVPGVTASQITENTTDSGVVELLSGKVGQFVSYNIELTGYTQGDDVIVTLPVPAGFDTSKLIGVSIEDGVVVLIKGTYNAKDNTFSFVSNHFSTKAVAETAATVSGSGNLVGGKVYTLATNGVTANKNYLIVNVSTDGTAYALTNNNGTVESTEVTIADGKIIVSDDSKIAWTFSGTTSGTISNNGRFVNPESSSLSLTESNTNLVISDQKNGEYRIYRSSSEGYYYLRYKDGWKGKKVASSSDKAYSVYLYEYTSSSNGEEVNFSVAPGGANLKDGETINLTGTVTVGGVAVNLSNCTIAWKSSDETKATVSSDGVVTGVAEGTANITATLSKVNDTALQKNIVLTIPVTVTERVINFTVNPNPADVQVGNTVTLTGAVTVDNVPESNCTITWASSNTSVATVSTDGGVVTGVATGTATITATLSAVDGKALQTPIVLTIPVTVQSKAITNGTLKGNHSITVKFGEEPNYSDIYLEVTYDDGTTGRIPYTALTYAGIDKERLGTFVVTVSYGGTTYGNVAVTVVANYPQTDATVYPEYPSDGAVRIDKYATEMDFENTGIVKVEMDVAGVSVKKGIDAVLTIDVSNSMAWEVGTKTDNFEENKLTAVMSAVMDFATILLAPNADGTPTLNTISIVTFAGKDSENWNNNDSYIDSVRTLVTQTSNLEVIQAITQGTKFTGKVTVDGVTDYGLQVAYIPAGQNPNAVGNVVTDAASINRGDTNYDYAFWQTEKTVDDIIAANGVNSNREIHVLFMSDGCASNFNGSYYRTKNAAHAYIPGTKTVYTGATYADGTAWTNKIMDLIKAEGGNTYAKSLYAKVADINAVGFDMANGSFAGISTWDSAVNWDVVFTDILKSCVLDSAGKPMINAINAADTKTLNEFYSSLATKIRYAGTQAQATDVIGSKFTLQMGATAGTDGKGQGLVNLAEHDITPEITIKAYDLYTKDETSDVTLIGTRKGTYTDIETISFSADGTKAYSNLIENENIMTVGTDGSVVIAAYYFTYTKTADGVETFIWNIGNITDKEIAFSFYAYLKGSLEGEQPKGLVYTNEEATIEYVDINGDHASQTFPVPAVAWGGASTAYEFYLVNEDGQPCDRNGNVIPFANRIIITGPFYDELYLNQDGQYVSEFIAAAYVLPVGYTLFDPTSSYEVMTASGTLGGFLRISEPYVLAEEGYTGTRYSQVENVDDYGHKYYTYVEDASGAYKQIPQTTKVVSAVTPSYIQSRVAFGVMYNDIPTEAQYPLTPDQVVIDYGKDILIDITNSADVIESGYTATLIGFSKYYDSVDLKQKFSKTNAVDNFNTEYGTFSIEKDGTTDGQTVVRYKPTKVVNGIDQVFAVIKMTNGSDVYYMADKITVIPATNVYYETDFSNGVFITTGGWSTQGTTQTEGQTQDDGTVGKGQTYGYDSTYEDDAELSNGSSLFVEGAGVENTTVTFSFKGTGFDIISRTGANQGFIRVSIYQEDGTLYKSVTVLNKSESRLELYQIPVVSVHDLPYGVYSVTIGVNAAYENKDYPALNRGGEFYFDAIRIYDPAKGDTIAEAAYAADGEANTQTDEVRDLLIEAGKFEAIGAASENGIVFIDRDPINGANIATYETIGPNNEVYLAKGQAIAFKITASSVPASIDVGAKSITGAAAQLSAVVTDAVTTNYSVVKDIASSTAQYINLMNETTKTAMADGTAYVIITNTGDGVLSITDIKVAYNTAPAAAASDEGVMPLSLEQEEVPTASAASAMTLSAEEEVIEAFDPYTVTYTVDAATFTVARSLLTAPAAPEAPDTPEPTEPEPTEPEPTEPEPTEPEPTEPEPTEPEPTEPEPTEPEPTEPEPTEPEPTEPETEPNYDILSASVKTSGGWLIRKVSITVTTTQDVAYLRILRWNIPVLYSGMTHVDCADGTRVWTVTLPSLSLFGNGSYTIIGYGTNGAHGDPMTVGGNRH